MNLNETIGITYPSADPGGCFDGCSTPGYESQKKKKKKRKEKRKKRKKKERKEKERKK